MIMETIYRGSDLTRGKCSCCCEMSDEILIGDGRCVTCIQEEEFEQLLQESTLVTKLKSIEEDRNSALDLWDVTA